MRDDELRSLLTDSNPWWRSAAGGSPTDWVSRDRLLRDKKQREIGFRATILDDVAADPTTDSLVLLQGPRRVGKSVTLRELAAKLTASVGLDARQVVSFSCDGLSAQDFTRAFRMGRELTRSVDGATHRPRVWLVDEVGQVRGWSARLKQLRDGSAVGDETVIATSSSWRVDEDVAGNLLAGRAGSSGMRRVRLLMPMSFRDFVRCTRHDLALPQVVPASDLQSPLVADALATIAFDVDSYDLAWQSYLSVGGFPRAVAHSTRTGQIDLDFARDIAAWLRTDIDPDAPPQSLPRLLEGLEARSTAPLNLRKAAVELGYRSRDVFDRRCNRLVGTFAAVWNPNRDTRGRMVPNTQHKLYLVDPLLGWLPSLLLSGCDRPDFTRLTEQALGVALARSIDQLEEGRWIANDTIGFARTDSGNEVDFAPVSLGGELTTPIESKWVSHGWRAESQPLRGKFGSGIVSTKSVLDLSGPVWAVPAPLIALLLG